LSYSLKGSNWRGIEKKGEKDRGREREREKERERGRERKRKKVWESTNESACKLIG